MSEAHDFPRCESCRRILVMVPVRWGVTVRRLAPGEHVGPDTAVVQCGTTGCGVRYAVERAERAA